MHNREEEVARINYLLSEMSSRFLNVQEYAELQYLLMRQESSFRSCYPVCRTVVNGEKIMFISDSHRGNAFIENRRLSDIAYNRAIQMNIGAVIHAGDAIEGCCVEHNKPYEIVAMELEKVRASLPNEVVTGLLLGNHDYSAIRTYPELISHFFKDNRLYVLGMQKVLLNWSGLVDIMVSHPIGQLKINRDRQPTEVLTLEGHHHYFGFYEEERKLDLPSISNDTFHMLSSPLYDGRRLKYYSLFVVAEKRDEHVVTFTVNCVDSNKSANILPAETIEVDTETKRLRLYK